MFDASGRLVVCNERYLQMYGLSPEIVKPGCTVEELVQARIASGTFFAADPQRYIAELLEAMRKREAASTTMELPDGRIIAVISHPTPDGNGWVVTHEDITERRRTEMERDRSQAFANIVIENVPSTIVLKDARTPALRADQSRRRGIFRRAAQGDDRQACRGGLPEGNGRQHHPSTTRNCCSTGEPQFYDERPLTTPERRHRASRQRPACRSATRTAQTQYLLTVIEDRTHRKRAEAQIARLVHHDLLTGLPNRAAFTACIDATIETAANDGHSFALMCLDFDRFKEVNDVYGHAAGDELLRQLSTAPAGRRRRRLPGPARRRRIRRDRHRRRTARRGRGHGGPAARGGQRRDHHRRPFGARRPQHRHRDLPGRWRRRRHADRQCRRRALSRQGRRARHVPLLRSRHGPAAARAARAAAGTAIGDRARRVGPALPAAGAHRRRDHRLRGAGPLAASAARPDPARHLHPARRGKRPDRRDGRMDPARGVPARRRPGPIRCRSRSTCRRCSSATATCRRSCIRCCWKPDCRRRGWSSRSPKAC